MLIKLAFVLNRSLSTLAFRVLFASSSDSLIVAPCCVSICAFSSFLPLLYTRSICSFVLFTNQIVWFTLRLSALYSNLDLIVKYKLYFDILFIFFVNYT